MLLMYHVVVSTITSHRDKIARVAEAEKSKMDLGVEGKIAKQIDAWVSLGPHFSYRVVAGP
jgi:hypothetical protein